MRNARAARRVVAGLPIDDIELIAERVAEPIAGREARPRQLIDAGELARRFGVTRTWVYDHAEMLGAIRLGHGPKARLRFDPIDVAKALLAPDLKPASPARVPPRNRQRVSTLAPEGGDLALLPIGRRAAARRLWRRARRPWSS